MIFRLLSTWPSQSDNPSPQSDKCPRALSVPFNFNQLRTLGRLSRQRPWARVLSPSGPRRRRKKVHNLKVVLRAQSRNGVPLFLSCRVKRRGKLQLGVSLYIDQLHRILHRPVQYAFRLRMLCRLSKMFSLPVGKISVSLVVRLRAAPDFAPTACIRRLPRATGRFLGDRRK